ncbi:uncharacterized protein LOC142605941 [Castanea sativa]|uniref:uncharacterized protein LOC142605941 n=1 Tax=Castanea sativa TaxID=21020 RepID=UPI003F64976B
MFNEIEGNFDDVDIRTFKVSLPAEHDLRKSLTRKPVGAVHQLMDRIDEYKRVEEDQQQGKGKAKMGGDPTKRNQSLHCQYHQERGHTTEDCRTLWNHLEQLMQAGKLKQFLHQPNEQGSQPVSRAHRDASSKPLLGKISVIFATLGRTGSFPSRVMFIVWPPAGDLTPGPKRSRVGV